jgi:hypothetical protein
VPTASRHLAARLVLVGVIAFVYFVLFPGDLPPLLHPIERALNVSNAVSPGLYAVLGVGTLAWAAVRIWGGRPALGREVPPPSPP